MSRKPSGATVGRVGGGILSLMIALLSPATATARQPDAIPSLSISIDVSTTDCRLVHIGYRVEWGSMTPDAGSGPATITLLAAPDHVLLSRDELDFGKKADKAKGKVRSEILRESGYFDNQTYPGLAYQLEVRTADGSVDALSETVAIPECVPMTPLSGPSTGGTVVTIVGGSTFAGSPPFTPQSMVTVGDVSGITPVQVGADGTWLQFVTPAGSAGTCVTIFTDPGLPFPLPQFCYAS
jgi:hypothetical protein